MWEDLLYQLSRLNRKIVTKMSSSNIGQWNKIKSPEKETHTHMETWCVKEVVLLSVRKGRAIWLVTLELLAINTEKQCNLQKNILTPVSYK